MKCPVCTTVNLSMSDRQGVEIDYCPQCRGVWLDRGELDKLIERSQAAAPQLVQPQQIQQRPPSAPHHPQPHQRHSAQPQAHYRSEEHNGHGYNKEYHPDYRSRKKKSFLGEIFDFD